MIIKEPSVFVVGSTRLSPSDLRAWAEFHGVADAPIFKSMLEKLIGGYETEIDTLIEFCGRHCYRSWWKGRTSNRAYLENVLQQGHGSVFEHANITLAISGVSRTLTHELVRHRAGAAYSQESQRYVDAKDMNVICPPLFNDEQAQRLEQAHLQAVGLYEELQNNMAPGQDRKRVNEASRSVLLNAAETRIVVTLNIRALRHILALRGAPPADAEIRRLMLRVYETVKTLAPNCFQDFHSQAGFLSKLFLA